MATNCKGKEEQLNTMCESCLKYGKSCKGTTEQVWTGCAIKDAGKEMR